MTARSEFVIEEEEEEDEQPKTLDEEFEEAKQKVTYMSSELSIQQKGDVYGLFKQATVGDCNEPKPRMTDLLKAGKHKAWSSRKGMTQDEAKREYIRLVESFSKKKN